MRRAALSLMTAAALACPAAIIVLGPEEPDPKLAEQVPAIDWDGLIRSLNLSQRDDRTFEIVTVGDREVELAWEDEAGRHLLRMTRAEFNREFGTLLCRKQ